jgi:hypothetical protein
VDPAIAAQRRALHHHVGRRRQAAPISHCARPGIQAAGHGVFRHAQARHEGAHLEGRRGRAQSAHQAELDIAQARKVRPHGPHVLGRRQHHRTPARAVVHPLVLQDLGASTPRPAAMRASSVSSTGPVRRNGGAAKARRAALAADVHQTDAALLHHHTRWRDWPPAASQAWQLPSVGWPANGSSPPGVKMRTR